MGKRLTLAEFIERTKEVHGNKYNYSKTEYVNSQVKVCIICPDHGEFWQKPNDHLNGQGCPKCKIDKLRSCFSMGIENFIEKSKKIHSDKYDYSKVKYVNNRIKVCIICPEHGEFWQTPDGHLNHKGCPKCHNKNKKYTTEEFIERAQKIHSNKYDYSKTIYGKNKKEKVEVICPIHGSFFISPELHLSGSGCKYCNKGEVYNTFEFIEKAKKIHADDRYDYSKVEYKRMDEKVCIICPEHGEFWQRPVLHLRGEGCPICSKKYRKGEKKLFFKLCKNFPMTHIEHSYRNSKILGRQEIDIYFPEYKIGVEYQGEQHFKPIDFGGYGSNMAEKLFEENLERDIKKNNICKNNDIKLFYFSEKYDNFLGEKCFTNFDELKKVIEQVIKKENKK